MTYKKWYEHLRVMENALRFTPINKDQASLWLHILAYKQRIIEILE